MKIEAGATSNTVKFMHDDGTEIKDLGVRSCTIEMEVNRPTTAFLEIIFLEMTNIENAKLIYSVGGHNNVKGLILEDGTLHYLPECEASHE